MTLRRVNDFSTEDPVMLDRELAQLEDNVSAEFDLIESTFAKQMTVASFMPLAAAYVTPLQPSEQRSFDTTQASAIAVLPALAPENFGRRFTILKRQAANAVSVACADPTVLINGSAGPLSVTAVGIRVFYCDATGYYS